MKGSWRLNGLLKKFPPPFPTFSAMVPIFLFLPVPGLIQKTSRLTVFTDSATTALLFVLNFRGGKNTRFLWRRFFPSALQIQK